MVGAEKLALALQIIKFWSENKEKRTITAIIQKSAKAVTPKKSLLIKDFLSAEYAKIPKEITIIPDMIEITGSTKDKKVSILPIILIITPY